MLHKSAQYKQKLNKFKWLYTVVKNGCKYYTCQYPDNTNTSLRRLKDVGFRHR